METNWSFLCVKQSLTVDTREFNVIWVNVSVERCKRKSMVPHANIYLNLILLFRGERDEEGRKRFIKLWYTHVLSLLSTLKLKGNW